MLSTHHAGEETLPRILTIGANVDLSDPDIRGTALETIEGGGIVLLHDRGFELSVNEHALISEPRRFLVKEPRKQNGRPTVTFDRERGRIARSFALIDGRPALGPVRRRSLVTLEGMMDRFGAWADDIVGQLLPNYAAFLAHDRITYRPNERSTKQPLHIDSSYGYPTRGRGMLRLFCNIDPAARARIWQVGERFEPFAQRYLAAVRPPRPSRTRALLSRLGLLPSKTRYDHIVAELRRAGKQDQEYQNTAPRALVEFPHRSCWLTLTDLLLHGAVSGRHSLDQTYLLPAAAMNTPSRSSLQILERLCRERLA